MTMAQRSWRSRTPAWLTVATVALACTQASAHRRDEYLQAARIAIDPARIDIELDLTPGIALASNVIGDIDRDRDGHVAGNEANAYAARVLGEIQLEVDGRPMPLELVEQRFPTVPAVVRGEGTIQIRLAVAVPPLTAGHHRVRYRNDHRPDIAVYLANALVPASRRIAVQGQRRTVDQRDIVIDFLLDGQGAAMPGAWFAPGLAAALFMATTIWFRRWRGGKWGRGVFTPVNKPHPQCCSG